MSPIDFSKFTLFLIYFWFGALKVMDLSPASPLVLALLDKTVSFISDSNFLISFGLFEMFIGILFLIRGLEKVALFLISLHIIMIVLPLFLLPHMTWQGFFIPSLEGQYIIKNVLIIAIVFSLTFPYRAQKL